jgi:hypothetical protein
LRYFITVAEELNFSIANEADDIAENLVITGFSKQDIIWRFQLPLMRQYTGYALE